VGLLARQTGKPEVLEAYKACTCFLVLFQIFWIGSVHLKKINTKNIVFDQLHEISCNLSFGKLDIIKIKPDIFPQEQKKEKRKKEEERLRHVSGRIGCPHRANSYSCPPNQKAFIFMPSKSKGTLSGPTREVLSHDKTRKAAPFVTLLIMPYHYPCLPTQSLQ
jgi:hypothetical protein